MLPWHNLRFWYVLHIHLGCRLTINGLIWNLMYSYAFRSERTKLNSILSEDVVIMPCKGILRACAMSLPVSS